MTGFNARLHAFKSGNNMKKWKGMSKGIEKKGKPQQICLVCDEFGQGLRREIMA